MQSSAWDYYKEFLSWDIEKQNQELLSQPPEFWEEVGAQKALEVFHAAAERVPAYKKFLKQHDIKPSHIKTIEDFAEVPPVDKKNYLRAYPLAELCWDGDLSRKNVISVSSGSTGQPFFWPRDIWQEHEVDHFYELTLRYLFECDKHHTLIVIAFAMGMYIAGPFTFASCLRAGQKGYPLAVVTPSNDIAAVLRVVQNLAPQFEQVIIGGYPPMIKDILDAGAREGIDWKAKRTKLFFGGEGFSCKWRDYIHGLIGASSDLNTTINMYGTADAALVGIETPVSIAFRRSAACCNDFRLTNFQSERLPSMVTYNPLLKYFETAGQHLLFTSSSGIPLIRYKIGDVGGLVRYNDIVQCLAKADKSLEIELKRHGVASANWRLPLVYLFGRDDFTVTLYALNIYPENIKEGLEDARINQSVTGKFIMTIENRKDMSPFLNLRVELAPGVLPERSLNLLVKKVVTEILKTRNFEYSHLYRDIGKRAEPKIKLEPHGSKDFKIGIKHSWVSKLKA